MVADHANNTCQKPREDLGSYMKNAFMGLFIFMHSSMQNKSPIVGGFLYAGSKPCREVFMHAEDRLSVFVKS